MTKEQELLAMMASNLAGPLLAHITSDLGKSHATAKRAKIKPNEVQETVALMAVQVAEEILNQVKK